ncbi:uncharacterized protein LOC144431969 [Styela clava]
MADTNPSYGFNKDVTDPSGQPPPYSAPANPQQPYPPMGQAYPPMGQAYPPPSIPPGGQNVPYMNPSPQGVPPMQRTEQVVVVQSNTIAPMIHSRCPNCNAGVIQLEFTMCGICLGIWFFPLGMLCCFAMREPRCTHCRMLYVM